jgi:sulfoquinovosyltransferase
MTNGHADEFLMVYVGRLGSEKRLKDLRGIVDRMTNTRLCFVGTGPQEDELRQDFPDAVFLGQLTGEELSRAFASADVFCMPSDSETLGFVVLESMASGVPVVAVRAGGVPDLIEDGVTGFLVDPGDTDTFVHRLMLLNQNKQLRAMISTNARMEMEKWSWQASMKKLRNDQYEEARNNFEKRLVKKVRRLFTAPLKIGNPALVLFGLSQIVKSKIL